MSWWCHQGGNRWIVGNVGLEELLFLDQTSSPVSVWSRFLLIPVQRQFDDDPEGLPPLTSPLSVDAVLPVQPITDRWTRRKQQASSAWQPHEDGVIWCNIRGNMFQQQRMISLKVSVPGFQLGLFVFTHVCSHLKEDPGWCEELKQNQWRSCSQAGAAAATVKMTFKTTTSTQLSLELWYSTRCSAFNGWSSSSHLHPVSRHAASAEPLRWPHPHAEEGGGAKLSNSNAPIDKGADVVIRLIFWEQLL